MDSSKENEFMAAVELPYPPIHPGSRNPEYAYAILSNVGSGHSEMSTISLYFYNSIVLIPAYEELAHCFQKISMVEMHHLHIFAEIASCMGLEPRLWSANRGRPAYWSPAYNRYFKTPLEIIKNAIYGEQNAIEKYTRQAERIQDENIVENLERIILDEELHVQLLQEMLEQIH